MEWPHAGTCTLLPFTAMLRHEFTIRPPPDDMPISTPRRDALRVLAVAVAGVTAGRLAKARGPAGLSATADLVTTFRSTLAAAGWTAGAADAVGGLLAPYLALVAEADPKEPDRIAAELGPLGGSRRSMALLVGSPEYATLLAGTPNPDAVARSLDDARTDEDRGRIGGLYAVRPGAEAVALAEALAVHRELILDLGRRGVIAAERFFLFPRDDRGDADRRDAVSEYDRWLDRLFSDALRRDRGRQGGPLADAQLLAGELGTSLRRRLIDDEGFRRTFNRGVWPKYERAVRSGQIAAPDAIWEPGIFELLARRDGTKLLARWGSLAVHLLGENSPCTAPGADDAIAGALLRGDNDTVKALMDHGDKPAMVHLLTRRRISDDTRAAALKNVTREGVGAGAVARPLPGLLRVGAGRGGRSPAVGAGHMAPALLHAV